MNNNLLLNFQQAYRNLDLSPLTEDDLEEFGVKYGADIIANLKHLIISSKNTNSKVILSGHRGCGKSTLLAELKRNLDNEYFITFFSISDLIEMSDVNHINILFATAVNLMEEAEQQSIKIKKSTKDSFYNWFAEQTQTNIDEYKTEVESGFNFTGFFAWIKGILKTNAVIRNEIKLKFERKVSDLVNTINLIATTIQSASNKPVLVIIDDIDKIDIALAKDIFHQNLKALLQPNFSLVMTIPIAALTDKNLVSTLQSETNNQMVSMPVAKLYQKGERNQPNPQANYEVLAQFTKILSKRIDSNLIEPDIVIKIVLKSGGVLRELIRIANQCCSICLRSIYLGSNHTDIKINKAILNEAIKELRLDFASRIGKRDYEILTTTYQNFKPDDLNEQECLNLLHSLYILEYRNDQLWYDVHPIVVEILQQQGMI